MADALPTHAWLSVRASRAGDEARVSLDVALLADAVRRRCTSPSAYLLFRHACKKALVAVLGPEWGLQQTTQLTGQIVDLPLGEDLEARWRREAPLGQENQHPPSAWETDLRWRVALHDQAPLLVAQVGPLPDARIQALPQALVEALTLALGEGMVCQATCVTQLGQESVELERTAVVRDTLQPTGLRPQAGVPEDIDPSHWDERESL